MAKVKVKANYNIWDLRLEQGREYMIDEKDAKKYSEIKMMYMKDFMVTIIKEEKKQK